MHREASVALLLNMWVDGVPVVSLEVSKGSFGVPLLFICTLLPGSTQFEAIQDFSGQIREEDTRRETYSQSISMQLTIGGH